MSGVPDYTLEDTLDFKFTTRRFSTGAPFAFASGAIEIYEDNSVTQITGAETLTLEFDGVAGLHNLRVAATAANGFENGKSYHCVVSAGTVDSVSVVGEVVQQFSIGRAALTAAERNSIADALLNRDMSAVSDTTARSPLNALRFIRNKWSIAGTTLTVTKEDDSTSAWTATVTADAAADPITGNDPA